MPLYARILKSEIEKTIKKASDDLDINFITQLKESTEKSQKLNKILLKKLDDYLNTKTGDFTFESDPDVENILDDFIREDVTIDFISDNFDVNLSQNEIENLHDYVYNNFDDLYDEIDSRIEDERDSRDEKRDTFDQRDFI